MLLIGGKEEDNTLKKTGYIVDWITKTSTEVPSMDLDIGIWAASCSYYKAENPHDDKVIMAGGNSLQSDFLDDLRLLDLNSLTWTVLAGKSQTRLACKIVNYSVN